MMTLVFIAKNLQVENPVAMVNLHPLPELPSGLSRAHLLRWSRDVVRFNLVDSAITELEEYRYNSLPGTFSYDDTSVLLQHRHIGWRDDSWSLPLMEGMTWMAVALPVEDGPSLRMLCSADYLESGRPETLQFTYESPSLRYRVQSGEITDILRVNLGGIVQQPVMSFAAVRGSSRDRAAFVPHKDNYSEDSFSWESDWNVSDQGVIIGATRDGDAPPVSNRLYMVAQWDRVLSRGEMTAAYNALKPWLASRGVVIA